MFENRERISHYFWHITAHYSLSYTTAGFGAPQILHLSVVSRNSQVHQISALAEVELLYSERSIG